MFDQVGRGEDVALRRRASALMMTGLTVAVPAGILFGLATVVVHDTLQAPEPAPPMVFVAPPELNPLEAPAAPPPARRGTADAASPAVAPPVATDTPKPLSDLVPPKVVGSLGNPKGSDLGDDKGKLGGEPLSAGTGDRGAGASRSVVVRFDELELKRKIEPDYPVAAKGLSLGEQHCVATVRISEEGVPTRVDVRGCPEVFHAETRSALLKWRFYPVRAGKTPVSTITTVGVRYRLD